MSDTPRTEKWFEECHPTKGGKYRDRSHDGCIEFCEGMESELSTLRAERDRYHAALKRIGVMCITAMVPKYQIGIVVREALAPRGPEGEG